MNNPKLGETITIDFITSSPSTGAVTDADSGPTCEVFEDSTDTAILSPTVTKRSGKTGDYRVSIDCTSGNGFEAGKSYNVVASATVGSVAGKGKIATFQLRTSSIDDIISGVWDRLTSAITTANSIGKLIKDNLDAAISSRLASASITLSSGKVTVGTNDDKTGYGLSSTAVQAIWDALTSNLSTSGSIGKLLVDNINATISSRLASASITLSSGQVTVGTNNDKTSYTLSSAGIQAVWDALTSALTASGSIGKLIVDNLNATVSSRLAAASITLSSGQVTVGTNNDKTSYTLSSAGIQAVWDALTSALTTSGSVGKRIVDNLDAAISGRSAPGDAMTLTSGERTSIAAAIWNALTSGLTTASSIGKLLVDNINATISSRLASAGYTAPDNAGIAGIKAKTDALPATPAATGDAMTLTSGERTSIAAAIWDRLTSALSTAGSIGKLLVDNINATISSRLASASYTAPDNAGIAGIKAKTDNLPASPAGTGDAMTLTSGERSSIATQVNATLTSAHGAGSWQTGEGGGGGGGGGGGVGAYSVTVTVTDGTNPVQGAVVRLVEGVNVRNLTTNADGHATFGVDGGTYKVTASKSGYDHVPENRTVTGDEAGTLVDPIVLTPIVIPAAPSDASLCRVYGYLETLDNQPVANAKIIFELLSPHPVKSERLIAVRKFTCTTNAQGQISSGSNPYVDLQRNDLMSPAGSKYRVTCPGAKLDKEITLAASTFDIASAV